MRKFVVSDLYDDKVMFDIILSYLEELDEDVLLVLNGNMIGLELDIYEKMKNSKNIIIEYLGGNLELELYYKLKCGQYKDFLGDLNTYYIFKEGIYYRPFLVAHGDIPRSKYSKIRDFDYNTVSRKIDVFDNNFSTRQFMGAIKYHKYTNPYYFLIKGGIPIHNEAGFFYNPYEHTLNIDGGCSNYLKGDLEYDHVPLVEVSDGRLTISTFNHNGDIIYRYSFDGKLEKEKNKVLVYK